MTTRRPTVCREPGCPQLQPCPTHHQPWAGSTRATRLPPDWPRRRARILRRDGHRCQTCGAPAVEVDHRVRGDDHSDANLAAICEPCHAAKSGREGNRARRGLDRIPMQRGGVPPRTPPAA